MSAPRFTVLVTRPADDAAHFAALLEARGYAALCAPMLHVHPVPQTEEAVAQALEIRPQAIIVTSRYALAALRGVPKTLPLLAVGEQTAVQARRLGFTDTMHAPTASVLVDAIAARCQPMHGPLLYVRGRDVAFPLAAALSQHGFTVEEVTVYAMEPTEEISVKLTQALAEHTLHCATFFSARTAGAFTALLRNSPHRSTLAPVDAVGLSEPVGGALAALPWRRIIVSAEPTLPALLAEVDKLAAAR